MICQSIMKAWLLRELKRNKIVTYVLFVQKKFTI